MALVDPLPAGNLIPDYAAWMHVNGDTTTAQKHWTDISGVADQIGCSKKTQEPSPYIGHTNGTALRNADGVGEDGCGDGSPDVDGAAYYVVAADSSKLQLEFTTHFVSNDITHFRFIVFSGPSGTGPWTEVWRPLDHDAWHSVAGTWAFLGDSPVYKKVIAVEDADDFYKIQFEGRYTSTDSSGQKWTGVYFRVTDPEAPADYADISVGTPTANNSGGSARTSISVSHTNDGDFLLVGVTAFSVTTSVPAYSNVAYGGVAMTKITDATMLNSYLSNRHLLCEWYYLSGESLPTGANNFTADLANADRDSLVIYSLSGADQTAAAIGRIYTAKDNTSTTRMTGDINTTVPKSHLFAQAACSGGTTGPFTPTGSWVEVYDINTGASSSDLSATSWRLAAVANPTTVAHDTASSADADFATSIVEIVPAAALVDPDVNFSFDNLSSWVQGVKIVG